jgi:hypothetical protein
MDGKPAWTTEAGVDAQLGELANTARQVIVLIDGFSQPTLAALDSVGWTLGRASLCVPSWHGRWSALTGRS